MEILKRSFLLLLIILLGSISGQVAEASIGMYYHLEDSAGVNQTDLFGVEFVSPLSSSYLMEASAATGSIIGDEQGLLLKAKLLKRLPGPKGYYLGAGYKFFSDDNTTFQSGGNLSKSIVSVKMKGFNQVGKMLLSTEISYAPFGFYNFKGRGNERMTAWNIELGFDRLLSDNLLVILRGSLGGENYGSFGCAATSFTLGLGYDI